MHSLVLKPGRERSLLRRHPWIFSGAVDRVDGDPPPGATVEVRAADGTWLARAAWSPASQIRARVWTFNETELVDAAFFQRRIEQAVRRRKALGVPACGNAYRLVFSEADGLPGLLVDRYDRVLVCALASAGIETWRAEVVDALRSLPEVSCVYERSDADVRAKEGLDSRTGVAWGTEPPHRVMIEENGLKFAVDVRNGHKTGFYLDQRDNRARVRAAAQGKAVLNAFAYTGGFGVAALAGGASHVVNVEDVGNLLEEIERNIALNALDPTRAENLCANVFSLLRRYDREGRRFDLIVLDPPKFADSQSSLPRAARGYKDINRLAFRLLNPGGRLFTFSCSGLMAPALFQKILADAALEAGRDARIVRFFTQAPDHPIDLLIPESFYLKGLEIFVE